jgi:hypothetical protein
MGNGSRAFLGKRRRIDRSIAHKDVAWEPEIGAVDARGAFSSQMVDRPAENLCQPEREISGGPGGLVSIDSPRNARSEEF